MNPSNLPPGVTDADIERSGGEGCSECGGFPLYRNSDLCHRCWNIGRADYLMDQQRDADLGL